MVSVLQPATVAVVTMPTAVVMVVVATDVHADGPDMSADDVGVRRSGPQKAQRERRSE